MNTIKYSFLAILLSLSVFTSTYGQVTITGKILEQNSNNPIPYVNIGILNSQYGTISNSDGSFSIKIPDSHRKENLLFSAIGYKKKLLQ